MRICYLVNDWSSMNFDLGISPADLNMGAFTYDVRCFLGIFDLPSTYLRSETMKS